MYPCALSEAIIQIVRDHPHILTLVWSLIYKVRFLMGLTRGFEFPYFKNINFYITANHS